MVKTLIIIAASALGLCLIFFVVAIAAGSMGIFHGGFRGANFTGDKPAASHTGEREWAWTGDSLKDEVPSNVHYQPGPGPARIIVRGSDEELDKLAFHKGELAFRDRQAIDRDPMLDVTLTGAVVKNFSFAGMTHLFLGTINQDSLTLNVAGSNDVDADGGHVGEITINIAGRGGEHLGKLAAGKVHVHIAGRGEVEIAPIDEADVMVMGRGDIKLMTRPKSLSTHAMGSVNVTDADGNTVHDD